MQPKTFIPEFKNPRGNTIFPHIIKSLRTVTSTVIVAIIRTIMIVRFYYLRRNQAHRRDAATGQTCTEFTYSPTHA